MECELIKPILQLLEKVFIYISKYFHVGNKPFRETNERNKYGKLFAIYQLHGFLKPENILDKKGI